MRILLTFSVIFFCKLLFAQPLGVDYSIKGQQPSKRKLQKMAEKAYEKNDYNSALALFEYIAEQDSSDTHTLYRTATLADSLGAILDAKKYYQIASMNEDKTDYPLIDFFLAQKLRTTGDYDEAITAYERFITQYSNSEEVDSDFLAQAKKEKKESEIAKKILKEQTSPFKDIQRMGYSINTDFFSEFAPYKKDSLLYFSRLYYARASDTTDVSKARFNVYTSTGEASGLNTAVASGDQNAHIAFSLDEKYMYDTNCEYIPSQKKHRCRIYIRERDSSGNWINRRPLNSSINLDGYTATQPSIAKDSDGNEVLYFSSDRPNGIGQMDIWKSTITYNEDGSIQYSEPENLGVNVNTTADDITPFYHQRCETLYFSTKGRPSMGGFDIYSVRWDGYKFEAPESLGYPINSSYDDMYFFRDEAGVEAYFASKRVDPEILKYEREYKGCCPDIYSATFDINAQLEIVAYCGSDPLPEVSYTMNGFAPRGDTYTIDAPIELDINEEYLFEFSKPNYTKDQVSIQTSDICETTLFSERVYIRPIENWTVFVGQNDANSGVFMPIDSVTATLINEATGDILNQKINLLNNKFTFSIDPKEAYKVELTREGFIDTSIIRLMPSKERLCTITDTIAMVEELPDAPSTTLYFHNAIPSRRASVLRSYEETYRDYQNMKSEYATSLQQYYENIDDPIMADSAITRVETFFRDSVQVGFEKLQRYLNTLNQILDKGKSVTVVLRGTASSRGSVDPAISRLRNQALSERRVNSVIKYMRSYKDIAKYIDNGQLEIQKEPLGILYVDQQYESKMLQPFGVYDPIAANLRSVQILDIKVNN